MDSVYQGRYVVTAAHCSSKSFYVSDLKNREDAIDIYIEESKYTFFSSFERASFVAKNVTFKEDSKKYECVPIPEKAKTEAVATPAYYDNSNGSLYKIAEQRGWNAYLFDAVKRLERGGKKDPLEQEIDKTIALLQLWKSELTSK